MAIVTVTRQESNLTNWMLSEVALVESQSGRKISALTLVYNVDGDGNSVVGVDLKYVEPTVA